MMLVPTYIAASAVEGVGVFAAASVEKGALIWKYDPSFDRLVPANWLENAAAPMQEFLRKYAYPSPDDASQLVIEIDNGRFMNHEDAPNTDFRKIVEGYALRDIKAGEELTCNYNEFDPGFELLPSLCAAFAGRAHGAARLAE